eukprot:scaffold1499_cov170-Amphora_coffeaeformis.AAC.21
MEADETSSDVERRREIRREYNRKNAQKSRRRTKEKIADLITQVEALEKQEASLAERQRQLQSTVHRLKEENELLRVSAWLRSRETQNISEIGGGQGLHLPHRSAYDNLLQEQQLSGSLDSPNMPRPFGDRLGEPQALSLPRDHSAVASPVARNELTPNGTVSTGTRRLLEFMRQRVSDSQTDVRSS